MLTWWLSQVSVKNGRHSSELPTRKSCQFSLLTSESGLSLCWAKSTHRKGRTSHCTQSLPTCPLLVKAAPSTGPHLHQATTNNKATMLPPVHTLQGTPYRAAVVSRKVEISHPIIHAWIPGSLFNLLFYLSGIGLP